MLKHLVLLKVRESTAKKTLDEIWQSIQAIKEELPGIMALTFGKNVEMNTLNQGFNFAYSMVFVDQEYYQNYLRHPHQEKINSQINAIIGDPENVIVFDHELALEV